MFRELDIGRPIKRFDNQARIQAEKQISNIVLSYQSKKDEDRIADYREQSATMCNFNYFIFNYIHFLFYYNNKYFNNNYIVQN